MAQQDKLFPEPEVVLSIDRSRGEPRLWVRRIAIWAQPGELIRDIALRRGLNIIWSPDPGSGAAELGMDAESGHGAGKTLFCRLLRYCLGEDTFSNDELRRSIAEQFPTGIVGAELMISGRLWAVIRPIGQTRRHTVREAATLEDLMESKEPAGGIQPLLDVLNALVNPPTLTSVVPEITEDSAWPFVIGWLTRDQECRFDHILDWRHPRAESRSPVLTKDQTLGAVRAFLGVLDDEELQLKNERTQLAEHKKSTERDFSYLQRRADDLRQDLIAALGIDVEKLSGGSLDLSVLKSAAEEQMRQYDRASPARPFGDELARARQERDLVLHDVAIVGEEIKRIEATEQFHGEQIKALRGERANLNAAEIKARLGPDCPVCRVPIDRALAEGCGLSNLFRDPESINSEKQDVATRLQYCNDAIAGCRGQASALKGRLSGLLQQQDSVDGRVTALELTAERQSREQRQAWFAVKRLIDEVEEFEELLGRVSKAQRKTESLGQKDEEMRDLQAAFRNRHREALKRINDLFAYVCHGVLGIQASGVIELSGSGLQASVQVGGQAMESLKAIAFDLTAMLLSMEGHSGIPAFLVHDSPREADLGQSIYHRVFRLVHSLEQISGGPVFQYIITTTSAPPDELCAEPYVVAKLSGSTVEERLLRRSLN